MTNHTIRGYPTSPNAAPLNYKFSGSSDERRPVFHLTSMAKDDVSCFHDHLHGSYVPSHLNDCQNGANTHHDRESEPDSPNGHFPRFSPSSTLRASLIGRPGKLTDQVIPARCSLRDWDERCFTVGIGGPTGYGKTALTLALCRYLQNDFNIAVATNDVSSREDVDFLIRNHALPRERIRMIETGGRPHAAICEDISANIGALEMLQAEFGCQLLFVESGGIDFNVNYSRELADFIIFVIDVSTGEKAPRKGGLGISQCDLLVMNNTETVRCTSASLPAVHYHDALERASGNGAPIVVGMNHGGGIDDVAGHILNAWQMAGSPGTRQC